ncbi:thiamine phosphate synthase [Campylobacter sp. MIT 12-8780]|uniref:thiamine phosphate synthase n=1 Tax=unclassified Campylobacter TaxID=2593542 RepID=UPI00115DEC79|nr:MULTISPECIES: thiamine phosphate synthase [unclassified Campylobacter]NDJ27438.1 thiamine phosphate synthase [Campylobacter sp. MIT 19-121]TQR41201.1 thiamine phosphate synthase [Campylobacter sp. MIT 12-8780]
MWAKKIIAITESKLCEEDFLKRVERLAKAKIDALILREKELSEAKYYDLAKEVLKICAKHKTTCILHYFDKVALKLNHRYFHCPLDILKAEPRLVKYFHLIGTSVHSEEELFLAEYFKCNYAIAGHIFESSCKEDLAPKGLNFLNELCKNAKIPIYAVGGINLKTLTQLKESSISGVCLRSSLMQEKNVKEYIANLRAILA